MGKAILVLTFLARSAIGLVCRRGARLTYPDRLTPLSPSLYVSSALNNRQSKPTVENGKTLHYFSGGLYISNPF